MSIIYFYTFILVCISNFHTTTSLFFNHKLPTITILLNPAGDTQNPGRQLKDGLERGITFQWAQELKQSIEQQYHNVNVIVTHQPGQKTPALHHANVANRLNVDLYISLYAYQETATKPALTVYRFSYDTFFTHNINTLWVPYHYAYRTHALLTQQYAQQLVCGLTHDSFVPLFEIRGPYTLPLAPIIGIIPPAILIEGGMSNMRSFKAYSKPLTLSLKPIIEHITNKKSV